MCASIYLYTYTHSNNNLKSDNEFRSERWDKGGELEVETGDRSIVEAVLTREVCKYLNNKLKSRSMHYSTKPFRQPPPFVILPLR